jgi:hypothetical protein
MMAHKKRDLKRKGVSAEGKGVKKELPPRSTGKKRS